MSTPAALLLREDSSPSLSAVVERSRHCSPPHPLYTLEATPTHLHLTALDSPESQSSDEGFESDIDSLASEASLPKHQESHPLVDCVCYTDVQQPHLLLFVVRREALVFHVADLAALGAFYLNFSALKALTSQRAPPGHFSLLQRTDANGHTHIEITRQAPLHLVSIDTPEHRLLRKVWGSADELAPKRPERRKKARAPPPPEAPPKVSESWANSVPRLLRKGRSKSETRAFTPMAYRYVDATPICAPMTNRLFGLSPRLREFPGGGEGAWGHAHPNTNLKSVIKKEENKRKTNEKKVTFSAYTTVQVV